MSRLYRCAGDILSDDNPPFPGQIASIQLKQFSETSNFLQYQKPLTPQHPYFSIQVKTLAPNSKIVIGVANKNIADDAQPGRWNNTVGFQSDTGRCSSAHNDIANTEGEPFGIGDTFGVLVTHFGVKMSTVMFLKNDKPVATRYLFESDQSQLLPTFSLENGPIDLGITWPEAVITIPEICDSDISHWMKHSQVRYAPESRVLSYDLSVPEVAIQGPKPMSLDLEHFEVMICETSSTGIGPSIAIATCSPLKPPPACPLLRDFFRWQADGALWKVKSGQRVGVGIHYNPDEKTLPNFNDKQEQLVMCYITLDTRIIYWKMLVQPEGGFYPLILLNRQASKVQIDVNTNRHAAITDRLDNLYKREVTVAAKIVEEDILRKEIDIGMFRKSPSILVTMEEMKSTICLPAGEIGIHTIQLQRHLTPDHCYFCLEVKKLNEDSVVTVGVASHKFPTNKYPGKHSISTGWVSRDGRLFFNEKSEGNTEGVRFEKGDIIGIEVHSFGKKSSVVLFMRNFRPIGTRYITLKNLLPTIALCGNGYDVEVDVYWQNQISVPPTFNVGNLEHWCLPEGALVDCMHNIVTVDDHIQPLAIQAPYSLQGDFNHFEIQIIDKFGEETRLSPPVIALTAAGVQNPTSESTLWQDSIRFWAAEDAQKSVVMGDLIGWGVMHLKSQTRKRDKLVITYLTINRVVRHTKVLFEPPGGFYPLVVLPLGVNRVKFEFGAIHMGSSPVPEETVNTLLQDAEAVIAMEKSALRGDTDIAEFRKVKTAYQTDKATRVRKKKRTSLKERLTVKRVEKDPNHNQNMGSKNSIRTSLPPDLALHRETSRTCMLL